jgi:glucokinase
MVVADIGATKTVVSRAVAGENKITLVDPQTFDSRQAESFIAILEEYRERFPFEKELSLCVGVAGPVENNSVRITHLTWPVIDGSELARYFNFKRVVLLNDLVVAGYGLAWMPNGAMEIVNAGQPADKANQALVSPGSGLGEAILHYIDGKLVPVASEGGHSDFAPFDGLTMRLWSFIKSRRSGVPVEAVLSGPGLANLYRFFCYEMGVSPSDSFVAAAAGNPGKAVLDLAQDNQDPAAVAAVRLFLDICASEAGNFALKGLTVGGVYVGGGIMPRLIPFLNQKRFIDIFARKGSHEALLRRIPVSIVTDTALPLYGAAGYLVGQPASF